MNRCLECGIGAGEKIIYNVRCEHYKLFFLFLIKLAALGAFFRKPTSPPLNLKRSSKTHQSSLNLKGGSTAFPKPLSPQGTGDVLTALLGAQTASL